MRGSAVPAISIIAGVLMAIGPGQGVAAPSTTTVEVRKRIASGYVEAGKYALEAGDFTLAAALFAEAYRRSPHPLLFLNQGHAHRLAGDRAAAVYFYQRFLAEVQSGTDADVARRWLQQYGAPEVAPADAPAEVVTTEVARRDELAAEPPPSVAVSEATAPPAPPTPGPTPSAPVGHDHGRRLRVAGIAAGAAGVVAIGVGVWFGSVASARAEELSRPGQPYDPALAADGEAAERNMVIGYLAGGALLSAGVAMYAVGRARRAEPRSIALVPQPRGALLVLSGALP